MKGKNKILMDNIVSYIDDRYVETSQAPSMREIAKKFNLSVSTVKWYIDILVEQGTISNNSSYRGLSTNKMSKSISNMNLIRIVGTIACGSPLFAEENIESYMPLPTALIGNGKFFILRASGDSMINVGINSGDYVVDEQQDYAEEGQIVVARIGDEATLKRFYIDKEKGKIRLHPENDAMEDMFFDEIDIQGIVVKSVKDFT
jgi:repressor LexA